MDFINGFLGAFVISGLVAIVVGFVFALLGVQIISHAMAISFAVVMCGLTIKKG